MEKITFELEAVTPMFLSGADQELPPELRPPSIKGVLRFWYRAIYSDSYRADENRLFGSTDQSSPHRSPFILRGEITKKVKGEKGSSKYSLVGYLGYGVIHRKREFFDIGSKFLLSLSFRDPMTLEDKIKILRSLWGMAMFGGLGSRSRRGLGSSTVIPQEGNKTLPTEFPRFRFKNRDDFIGEIESFAKTVRKDKGLPNFTSFSAASRIIVTKDFKGGQLPSGVSAWQAINDQFKAYRDYYGRPRTKHTEKDHHLMRDFLQGGEPPPSVAPQRAAFGLPHNYYFTRSLNRVKGFVDLIADDDGQPYQLIAQDDNPDNFELEEKKKEARRASPLFIHIHKFENGNASAVITFLPAVFIPPKKKIRLSGNGRYLYVDAPGFRAIEDFLQVLRNDPSNKEITP